MPKHDTINYDLIMTDFSKLIVDPSAQRRVQLDRMRAGKSPVTKKEVTDMAMFALAVGGGYLLLTRIGVGAAIMGIRHGWMLNRKAKPFIYSGRIAKEYITDDLEWEDFVYYATPGIARNLWDRYQKPKSSPAARRGNAEGPGGGTKKKSRKKGRVKRYRLPVDSSRAFGRHNPCSKGYFPKKIKGRWYCVLK